MHMQLMGMPVIVKSTGERSFKIIDIFKGDSDLLIDVSCAQDDDIYAQDLPIISLADLKDLSFDDRQTSVDTTDYKGEHTTQENYIPFEEWLDEIRKSELIDYVEKYIITAIEEAIQNKLL